MADLRMLQEQAQLLQNTARHADGSLKAVNARLDQQADANRKAFADQKLLIDNLTKDLGVVREKVDDNNVRVGSLSQEVDALRQLVQQALARPVAPPVVVGSERRAGAADRTVQTTTNGAAPSPPLRQPRRSARRRRRHGNRRTATTPPASTISPSTGSRPSSAISPDTIRPTMRSS